MTILELLQHWRREITPRRRRRSKPLKAQLRLLYPIVNDLFDEITEARNSGYTFDDIGAAAYVLMLMGGIPVQNILSYDVVYIYCHIRRDRELRGLIDE